MIVLFELALMIAPIKECATMPLAFVNLDTLELTVVSALAPMNALVMENVLTGHVFATVVLWELIVRSRDVRVDVETTNTVMMVPVLATLDSLAETVISEPAPMIALVTDIASMALAIAVLVGLVTIVHKRCALGVALAMGSASTLHVFANQATLVLIVH